MFIVPIHKIAIQIDAWQITHKFSRTISIYLWNDISSMNETYRCNFFDWALTLCFSVGSLWRVRVTLVSIPLVLVMWLCVSASLPSYLWFRARVPLVLASWWLQHSHLTPPNATACILDYLWYPAALCLGKDLSVCRLISRNLGLLRCVIVCNNDV